MLSLGALVPEGPGCVLSHPQVWKLCLFEGGKVRGM